MPVNLAPYGREVEQQLPLQAPDLRDAMERQAFYDFDADRYATTRFKRDAESSFDFEGRPHPQSGFTRECVDVLCEHLYCPGPSRKWSEPAGDEVLQKVYADNLINSLMRQADVFSTLNDSVAIQIDAGEGDYATRPITYRLWGREQFVVWTDPDDQTVPIVCCTKDKYDEQTRFRLWSDTEVWTYLTPKLGRDQTAGGRVPVRTATDAHDYGCLPFSFIHYQLPIRDFYGASIGKFVVKAEVAIDGLLFATDESIRRYLNPIPVAEGMPDQWKPMLEPGRWIRVPLAHPTPGESGGFEPGPYARLYFLQASIDVQGTWLHIEKYIKQALEAARIPDSAIRMEQMGVASGIALVVEQEPLVKRAENRRGGFDHYESDLAIRTLTCIGNHYGMPAVAATAETGKLVTSWPKGTLAVRTPDLLEMTVAEVTAGFKSHLMAIQEWYGVDRERALEIVAQIAEDNADMMAANPDLAGLAVPLPKEPQPGEQGYTEMQANANGEPATT
jgi:hypothetical protein